MTTSHDPYGPPPLPEPFRRRVTDDVPDDHAGRRADDALSSGLGALGITWFLFPPLLALRSIVWTWPGATPPSAAQIATAHRFAVASCVAAVGIPMLGWLLAVVGHRRLRRRRRAVRYFAVTTLLAALAVGGLTVVARAQEARDHPPPAPPRTYHCQELSGGGNECPGG